MKIIDHKKQSYAEIDQQSKIVFSLGILDSRENAIRELFWPVKCRDFLNECALKQWTGKDYCIWSFRTDEVPVFLPEQAVYLICKNIPSDKIDKIETVVENYFENFKEEGYYRQGDQLLAIKLPYQYLRYSVALSYITFLIRCVEQYDDLHDAVIAGNTNESSYLRNIHKASGITGNDLYSKLHGVIMSGKVSNFCGLLGMESKDTHTIHNGSGIMSTFINPNNEFTKALKNG